MAQYRIGTWCIDNRHPLQQRHRQRPHHPAWLLRNRHRFGGVAQHGDGIGGGGGAFGHDLTAHNGINQARFPGIEFASHHHQKQIFEMGAGLRHNHPLGHITAPLVDGVTQRQRGIEHRHGAGTDLGGVGSRQVSHWHGSLLQKTNKPVNGPAHVIHLMQWLTAPGQFMPFAGVTDKLYSTSKTTQHGI